MQQSMQFKPITVIVVLSLVVASLLVSGCTSSTTSNTSTSGNVDVKVISVTAPATIGIPKQGYKFVTYNATVTNTNAPSRQVNVTFFTLLDSNNNKYNVSQAMNNRSIAGFPNGVVTNPGDKVSGLLVFEVPQNATPANLVYNDCGLQATVTPESVIVKSEPVKVQVSAVSVTVPQQIGTYAPMAGYKFVGVNATIKNIADDKGYASTNSFQLRDTVGNIYTPVMATYSSLINGFKSGPTQPGDIVSGIIIYEVPQDATLKSITYNDPNSTNRVIMPL